MRYPYRHCQNCGKYLDKATRGDTKYCGANCRKQAERSRKNREKKFLEMWQFIETLEKIDLEFIKSQIEEKLSNPVEV